MLREDTGDLIEFDSLSADLGLAVEASAKFDFAVGSPETAMPGPYWPATGIERR